MFTSTLATWIRPVDEPHFARWFARVPGLRVLNAQLGEGAPDLEYAAGLLLTGGPDISAECLRQPVPDPSIIEDPEPARDQWEKAAAETALARGLPIFAICKGVQTLNVALGGTLHLDVPGHRDPECKFGNLQALRYDPTAPAALRFERVNSSHHQALDRLGDGLEVEAWCASDGVIEQVRLRGHPYCLGVQYHPERHEQYALLFDDFFSHLSAARIAACKG